MFACLLATYITGLRGIYLALAINCALYIFLKIKIESNLVINPFLWVGFFLGVTFFIVLISNPEVMQILHLSRSESDTIRFKQGMLMLQEIQSHPLFGTGFGSIIPDSGRLYSYEQFNLSLILKTGLFGILAGIFYITEWAKYFIKTKPKNLSGEQRFNFIINLICLTTIFTMSATNPYMFNFVGFIFIFFFSTNIAIICSK